MIDTDIFQVSKIQLKYTPALTQTTCARLNPLQTLSQRASNTSFFLKITSAIVKVSLCNELLRMIQKINHYQHKDFFLTFSSLILPGLM